MVADIAPDLSTAVFLDTSLVVAATVEAHPHHDDAASFVDDLISQTSQLCISPQICREFLVVLTRQPVSGLIFTTDEAIAVLEVWMTGASCLMKTRSWCRSVSALFGATAFSGSKFTIAIW